MKTFSYPILLAVALLGFAGCAKEKVISGKVTDEQGNALADAVVRIEGSDLQTWTGPDGTYTLDYTPGEVKLILAKDGYFVRWPDVTEM